MTLAKASALILSLVGAAAIGVWISPFVHARLPEVAAAPATAAHRPAPRAAARHATVPVSPSTPALRARLKPLFNQGADMNLAASGFRDGEQFAVVAHAAHDTGIPFVLLKHRVLDQHETLVVAIRKSKPALDVAVQADLARAQARADVAAIGA
jgi:hypothetical protein